MTLNVLVRFNFLVNLKNEEKIKKKNKSIAYHRYKGES